MSATPRPPIPSLIPESAPFSVQQRAWLNGLFAGLFGLSETITPVSDADAAKLLAGLLDGAVPPAVGEGAADDGAPWHDPAMPLADRMKLAEGRPLPRRLMAAMAQQDCGQCGYNCQDYADAVFAKSEEWLNLCVPGGKETSRMLKQLHAEFGGAMAAVVAEAAPAANQIRAFRALGPLPRQSGLRDLSVTPSPEQARLGKRDLAYRHRPCRHRSGLCRRRFLRRVPGQ